MVSKTLFLSVYIAVFFFIFYNHVIISELRLAIQTPYDTPFKRDIVIQSIRIFASPPDCISIIVVACNGILTDSKYSIIQADFHKTHSFQTFV